MVDRPRLTPAIADVRRAVRAVLIPPAAPVRSSGEFAPSGTDAPDQPPARGAAPQTPESPAGKAVLVALSGGADSLALAAATAFEAARAGIPAGAVVIDHGLQGDSALVAERTAATASELGLDPVQVVRVEVGTAGGPEAAARAARYAALDEVAVAHDAIVLLGHTLDDQAETVLLGLARGSGAASLQGMSGATGRYRRPLLGIRRATTRQACLDAGLEPWDDPQNHDVAYSRVRVRQEVLPVLERELGPGIAEALARTAEQLREDAAALEHFVDETLDDLVELEEAGVSLAVAALAANPAALRQRLVRRVALSEFHVSITRAQTLEICRLVTQWHGQGPLHLPGFTVERRGGRIHFVSTTAGALTGEKPANEH